MSFTDAFRKIAELEQQISTITDIAAHFLPLEHYVPTHPTAAVAAAQKAAVDEILKSRFPNGYTVDPKTGIKKPILNLTPVAPQEQPIPGQGTKLPVGKALPDLKVDKG